MRKQKAAQNSSGGGKQTGKASVAELTEQVGELAKVLQTFREEVLLLDEVDMVLHPLKSELNFPIGEKFDLDGADGGAMVAACAFGGRDILPAVRARDDLRAVRGRWTFWDGWVTP